jgi:hypothetical protein
MGKPKNIGVIGLKIFADADYHPIATQYLNNCPPRCGDFESRSLKGAIGGAGSNLLGKAQSAPEPSPPPRGLDDQNAADCCKKAQLEAKLPAACENASSSLDHDMGTEFGARTNFDTFYTHFNRGAIVAFFSIEYASHEKLVQAGILPHDDVSVSPSPNPFPADGCPPPPGWHG